MDFQNTTTCYNAEESGIDLKSVVDSALKELQLEQNVYISKTLDVSQDVQNIKSLTWEKGYDTFLDSVKSDSVLTEQQKRDEIIKAIKLHSEESQAHAQTVSFLEFQKSENANSMRKWITFSLIGGSVFILALTPAGRKALRSWGTTLKTLVA